MRKIRNTYARPAILFSAAFVLFAAAATAQNLIKLDVDATNASTNIVHIRETMAVGRRPVAVAYPEGIPGGPSPNGPLQGVAKLYVTRALEAASTPPIPLVAFV